MNAHQRRKLRRKGKGDPDHRLIKNWEELAKVPDSETHRLEIDPADCNGWIRRKDGMDTIGVYLSTHTFYGSGHARATRMLRQRGFKVTLANWDAKPSA